MLPCTAAASPGTGQTAVCQKHGRKAGIDSLAQQRAALPACRLAGQQPAGWQQFVPGHSSKSKSCAANKWPQTQDYRCMRGWWRSCASSCGVRGSAGDLWSNFCLVTETRNLCNCCVVLKRVNALFKLVF